MPSAQKSIQPSQQVIDTDFEMGSLDTSTKKVSQFSWIANLKFLFAGMFFGILLVKSELVSWYRIQEMFRFQSFHLYGVMASGIVVGSISILLIKSFNIKTISGEPIQFPKKKFHKGNIFGGLLFGFGWAMTGACPGPLYALVGTATIMIIPLLGALAGTWVYGLIREKLPH
jgi:uncharacterized membrane protein YedE/YeeE